MILQMMCGKVGRRHPYNGSLSNQLGLFCFCMAMTMAMTMTMVVSYELI